ncbi:MAG: hypothetical protein K5745_02395 [Saccharofermentans sp.]|nr:hypothetical protein [Saccharofermentans sp.]
MRLKQILKKAACVSIAGAMILSMAACNKDNSGTTDGTRRGETISADDPWYTVEQSKLDPTPEVGDLKEYDYSEVSSLGVIGDTYFVCFNGQLRMPEDFDWEHDDASKFAVLKILGYDMNTFEITKSFDMSEFISETSYISGFDVVDGKLIAQTIEYDMQTYDSKSSPVVIDPETGELSEDTNSIEDISEEMAEFDASYERTFHFDGNTIETYYGYEDEAFYKIRLVTADGDDVILDLEPEVEVGDIPGMIRIEEGRYLILCSTSGDMDTAYILNANTKAIEADTSGTYSWANNGDISDVYAAEDGNNYYVTSEGISKLDVTTGENELVVDADYCAVSRTFFSNFVEIVGIEGDNIILSSTVYSSSPFGMMQTTDNYIIKFTKAETNPNAGKTILELYSYGGYSNDAVFSAIADYNNADNDYFIEFSSRYSMDDAFEDTDWESMETNDDYEAVMYGAQASLSDQLAIDIMNGDGPDILLNTASLGQLNNSDYLVDVSDRAASLTDDAYFKNIIDASYTGEALYQLPLSFAVCGIQTAGDPGASGVGYTLDEYKDFVDDYCNGSDPKTAGQAIYFVSMFNTMYDTFIKDGQADFSSEEFAAMAEYCKDNVREHAISWNDTDPMYDDSSAAYDAMVTSIVGYYDNIRSIDGAATGVYGGPSVDGRGPGFIASSSFAISAQAIDVDACWDFVSVLLSEECQTALADTGENPISRTAFDASAQLLLDSLDSNADNAWMAEEYDFTEEDVERYEDICNSVSYSVSGDASISVILTEEMPAYFSGQKDLSEVTQIMQDRVQTILDERG